MARLVPGKAQHILIAAIDLLVRESPAGRIMSCRRGRSNVFPGKRGEKTRHFQYSYNRRSRQPKYVLLSFYEAADVFVFPSFAEGLGVALLEAMAMEIPCVATRITALPEVIRDGIDGLSFCLPTIMIWLRRLRD